MKESQRPLVVALLSFLAGLLLSFRFPIPPLTAASLLVPAILARLLVRSSPGRRWAGWVLPPMFAAGMATGAAARQDAELDCLAHLRDDTVLRVTGTLAAAHREAHGASSPPKLPLVDATVEGIPGCGGEIRVAFPTDQPELAPGTTVSVEGRWRTYGAGPVRSAWPRDPRYHGFLRADTVLATSAGGASWLTLRARADASLARLFPRNLPLVEALLLGRREYVDPEVRDRFARSGLSHLLAISGMHVGLLSAAMLLLGSAFRIPRRRATLLTLAATWAYLFLIGASASALRSGVMITLSLAALLIQRPSAALPIVATAAFVILAIRPLAILDPGFQLSFAGVLSILLLRRPFLALVPEGLMARKPARYLIDGLLVGLAAFLVTAPIVAHHFGVVAPISIVAGLPAVPLMSLALIGAAAALSIEPILPSVASLMAGGAGLALELLDRLAGLAAAIPYGNGTVPPPPWWSWGIATFGGLLLGRWPAGGRIRLRWIVGIGSAMAVLVLLPLLPLPRSDSLEIHFIDVGQGDAIAIRTPHDRWILVDAGPASADFDAGARRVLPFLRAHGATRLEAFILSHPDLDHIGGANAVVRSMPVHFAVDPGFVVGKAAYVDFLAAFQDEEIQWLAARSGRVLRLDDVSLEFLWPDPETVDAYEDANQISAVVKVTYGTFALLLTGDAGTEVEDLLVQRHGNALDADVLKLGHHGSSTSTSDGFLDAVSPELAVVSAGRRNRYGHPAGSVLARLERHGIPVARTDREGTVSIRVVRHGAEWRRAEW